MKIKLLTVLFLLLYHSAGAQGCFEIESILVDACGSPEGQNEMVRLRIGQNNLNSSDLVANWPNNSFLGLCSSPATAAHVNYMNSTIQSCGYFLEPTNDLLPAGSNVLLITSADFDPTSHNYAGLSDTIYVLFQCTGNTFGHFANWTSPCDPLTGDRTLTIDIGLCSETVTYNKCDLINQTGGIGGTSAERDGARVEFDSAGTPDYQNDGCTIPYSSPNVLANYTNGSGIVCLDTAIDVTGSINGNFSDYFWTSSFGDFTDNNQFATTYTPTSNQAHYIYFNGINGCNDTLRDSLFIDVIEPPVVLIQENIISTDCEPGSIELYAIGAATYQWNTGANTSLITPNLTGQYIVIGSNSCGSDSDTTDVIFGTEPLCQIDLGTTLIVCEDSIVATALTNAGSILWSTGDTTASITITAPGDFSYTATSNCGTCGDTVTIQFENIDANFIPNTINANVQDIFDFFNLTLSADQFAWYIDGDYITNSINFAAIFDEEGTYTITLEATNSSTGCTDTYSLTVTVFDDYTIQIPNIITPNQDGSNDNFGIWLNQELRVNAFVLNRWGNVMVKSNFKTDGTGYTNIWDGMIEGAPASEGVYFYKIIVNLADGPVEYHGHFQLVR